MADLEKPQFGTGIWDMSPIQGPTSELQHRRSNPRGTPQNSTLDDLEQTKIDKKFSRNVVEFAVI